MDSIVRWWFSQPTWWASMLNACTRKQSQKRPQRTKERILKERVRQKPCLMAYPKLMSRLSISRSVRSLAQSCCFGILCAIRASFASRTSTQGLWKRLASDISDRLISEASFAIKLICLCCWKCCFQRSSFYFSATNSTMRWTYAIALIPRP